MMYKYCLYLYITVTLSSLSAYDFHSTMHECGLKSKVHGYTVQSPRMVCHFLGYLEFIPREKGPPKTSVMLQPRHHPLLHLAWRYCWRVGCMETDRNIQNPAFRMAWNQVAKKAPCKWFGPWCGAVVCLRTHHLSEEVRFKPSQDPKILQTVDVLLVSMLV